MQEEVFPELIFFFRIDFFLAHCFLAFVAWNRRKKGKRERLSEKRVLNLEAFLSGLQGGRGKIIHSTRLKFHCTYKQGVSEKVENPCSGGSILFNQPSFPLSSSVLTMRMRREYLGTSSLLLLLPHFLPCFLSYAPFWGFFSGEEEEEKERPL